MIGQKELKDLFDYCNGDLIWKTSSAMRIKIGDIAGGTNGTKQPYKRIRINGKRYMAHKLVYLWHHGYMPETVDHVNGNISDNRVENLRAATKSQNRINSKTASHNKSGCKNVHWFSRQKVWSVNITVNKKRIFIGNFDVFELAELVATEARNKFHGEFANHF